jgi:hypothetical protein
LASIRPAPSCWDILPNRERGALASIQRRAGGLDLRNFPLDGPLPELPPSNAAKGAPAHADRSCAT